MAGAWDYFLIAIPVLFACLAGAANDRKIVLKSVKADPSHHDKEPALNSSSADRAFTTSEMQELAGGKTNFKGNQERSVSSGVTPATGSQNSLSTAKDHISVSTQCQVSAAHRRAPAIIAGQSSTMKLFRSHFESVIVGRELHTPFCPLVTIESPSPATSGEKLAEGVGFVTSNGEFIPVLEKLSWLPHCGISRIPLEIPITEPMTIEFARKIGVFRPEYLSLGTYVLTGFSKRASEQNVVEIRVRADTSGLFFDVRDSSGSHIEVTPESAFVKSS